MLLENTLYCSAWISSNALLLLLTLGPIQFALLKTHERFQQAVRTHSAKLLRVTGYFRGEHCSADADIFQENNNVENDRSHTLAGLGTQARNP